MGWVGRTSKLIPHGQTQLPPGQVAPNPIQDTSRDGVASVSLCSCATEPLEKDNGKVTGPGSALSNDKNKIKKKERKLSLGSQQNLWDEGL